MSEKVRINLQVSAELAEALDSIADEAGGSRTEVIRQAVALMKIAHDARKKGRFIGIVDTREKLDTEIIGVM